MTPDALRQHTKFWFAVFVVFLFVLWALRGILLPFVFGIVLAYFLEPVMARLANRGMPRTLAALLVLLGAVIVLFAALAVLVPALYAQAMDFILAVPDLAGSVKAFAMPYLERVYERLSPEDVESLKAAVQGGAGKIVAGLSEVAKGVWLGGIALFDVVSFLIIAPVVVFYLLRDWDVLTKKLESWMPKPQKKTIKTLLGQVNQTLSGFLRGQASVCVILGLFYGLALSLAGLKFGLVIGFAAGILSFIPYVGSIVGFVVAMGVGLFQFQYDWVRLSVIAAIFILGQILEGAILSPRIIGDKVGLHPLWIIFALMAGGSLFGFIGVLVAIPVAAVIGVLTRFGLKLYLDSPYYHGPDKGREKKKNS